MGRVTTDRFRVDLKFLIVDDDDYYTLQLKAQILKITGQDGGVFIANTLEAGLQVATEQAFDVCFVDFGLVAGQSDQIVQVKNLARALVFLCDHTSKTAAYQALNFGAKEFLIKSSSTSFEIAKGISYALYWKHQDDAIAAQLAQEQNGAGHRVSLFDEHLRHALEVAKRGREKVGLLMIGLRNFDPIIEDFGQEAGGQVLHQIGERISNKVRISDIVTRLNEQQFGTILCKVSSKQVVTTISNTVTKAISERPYNINGQALHIGANVGASTYPDDGETLDDLKGLAQDLLVAESAKKLTIPTVRPFDYY